MNCQLSIALLAIAISVAIALPCDAQSGSRQIDRAVVAVEKSAEEIQKEEEEAKIREANRKRGEYTFDDLKFDIERGGEFEKEMLTEIIHEAAKRPSLKIRGYILPTSVFQQTGIKQFVLVRDNQECCFGPGAMLYDCIMVEMAEGKTTKFSTRPVMVQGKFSLDTETYRYPDGAHFAVFKMIATEVK